MDPDNAIKTVQTIAGGVLAAIIISILAVVAIIIAICVCCCKCCSRTKKETHTVVYQSQTPNQPMPANPQLQQWPPYVPPNGYPSQPYTGAPPQTPPPYGQPLNLSPTQPPFANK